MTDMYEYERIDPSLGCDGAKYVFCSRKISAQREAIIAAKANELFGRLIPRDNDYSRRLAETEKNYFPYSEPKHKTGIAAGRENSTISGLKYQIIKDVDTRDNSEIYVVKVLTRVDDFSSLRREMDSLGGYYSRFKRGFIFKKDPTAILRGDLKDIATETVELGHENIIEEVA
jgi:hypothetical protein